MNIDISKIEGYENMTAEEKVKALEAFTIPDPDYTGYVKKSRFDEVASELAASKKDLKARMSAEEVAKAEQEAAIAEQQKAQADLQSKYDELLKKTEIADNKAKLIAIGYDEKLAEETATAMIEKDLATVIKNQQTVMASIQKKAKGEAMASTPTPDAGKGTETITKAQFEGMTYTERNKLYTENPELYKTLSE
jgi:hypothetical protein